MSGIEIVLIVAAGIAIAHKLDQRKKRKQAQRQLLAQVNANSNPTAQPAEQAGSRTRRPNQQVPVEEEETLPLYSPPTKHLLASSGQEQLPTYDESGSRENTVHQYAPPPEKLSSDSQVCKFDSTTATTTNPFADSPAESHSQPEERPITLSFPASWYVQRPSTSSFEDTAAPTAVEPVSPQPSNSSNSPSVEKAKSSKVKFWKRHTPTATTPTVKAST